MPKYINKSEAELKDLFFSFVNKTDACWEWKGGRQPLGYGRFSYKGKRMLAHRVSFLMHNGWLPDDLFIRHKCDNGSCVNPGHLIPGTQLENMHDMQERGRKFQCNKTHCVHGHEFTPENTAINKTSGGRCCKICRHAHNKAKNVKRTLQRDFARGYSLNTP